MTDIGERAGFLPDDLPGFDATERPEAELQVEAYRRAVDMGSPAVLGCSDIYTTDWDGYPEDQSPITK